MLKIGDRVRDKRQVFDGRNGTVDQIAHTWTYDYFGVKWDDGDHTWFTAEGGWEKVELLDNEPLPLPGQELICVLL